MAFDQANPTSGGTSGRSGRRWIDQSQSTPEGYAVEKRRTYGPAGTTNRKLVAPEGQADTSSSESNPYIEDWGVDNAGEVLPYADVEEGDDEFASKTRANLARAQFEDYKKRFKPFEEELVDMGQQDLSDTGLMGEATQTAAGQFDTAQETAQRNRTRYGLGGGQSESAQRNSALDRAASIVGAQNRTRDQYQSQQLGLLGGMGGN